VTQPNDTDIPRAYTPQDVESRIYRFWEKGGYSTAKVVPGKKPFVIIMPPPNVTGELHLGHALTASLEDVLARWHRMMGDPTLWLPGKDHAGIATQWVVEQQLAQEGISRQDLGREKFLERVWQWVGKYGNTIDEQYKRLGTSFDWSRLKFTLDSGPGHAVLTTFTNLYRKGLIYRGERIINWCPRCTTALSDLEVQHDEVEGRLYYIRYPLQTPHGGYIIVSTTRPETMLGDTGVAVHPDDPRYSHLVGTIAILPIVERELPIVGDSAIEMEFGTGALKVTPGHDPVDFDIGTRHRLPVITIIGPEGRMTQEAGPYAGQDRMEARNGIVAHLEKLGLLERTEPYLHSIGHCQRCTTVVEPLVSTQWFLSVGRHDDPTSIAGRAYLAVKEKRINIVPQRFARVYLNWLENIRDWCISRQLWWGHRIPVWYCLQCDEMTVSVETPTGCAHCGCVTIQQDEDVLDTWFSSALWTHSTLGWPDQTEDMDYFYPTSVMETGYDILFFWVARMIMMGIENTGVEPFHTVFLHGLIRSATGEKMSKTKGNILNPLELIDRYGADALRFALTTGTAPGNDIKLAEAKLESARNFANKLWNASRFVSKQMEDTNDQKGWCGLPKLSHLEDRWIVSRLNHVTALVHGYLVKFEIGEAQREIHAFVWHEFCDWYIEMAKVRLRSSNEPSPLPVLAHVLERILRLLHPFMPFITEELWQMLKIRLPEEETQPESIMIAPYPESQSSMLDERAEAQIDFARDIVVQIRNYRAEQKIEASQQIQVLIDLEQHEANVDTTDIEWAIETETVTICQLARIGTFEIVGPGDPPLRCEASDTETINVFGDQRLGFVRAKILLPTSGLRNVDHDRVKLKKEIHNLERAIATVEAQIDNKEFQAKAPAAIREQIERKRIGYLTRMKDLEENLVRLG
jgi:valyl-tRNA synthetase